jgi:hypothetical protein
LGATRTGNPLGLGASVVNNVLVRHFLRGNVNNNQVISHPNHQVIQNPNNHNNQVISHSNSHNYQSTEQNNQLIYHIYMQRRVNWDKWDDEADFVVLDDVLREELVRYNNWKVLMGAVPRGFGKLMGRLLLLREACRIFFVRMRIFF